MISVASSIKFRKVDGLSASFDNTFHADETFGGAALIPYYQKVYSTDVVTIQAKVPTTQYIEMSYSLGDGGAWVKMFGETLMVTGTVYDYYEISVDFSVYSTQYIRFKVEIFDSTVLQETWISEPLELLTETDDQLLKVEFFNYDNAFEVDYTTEIVHAIRVSSELKEYRPGGETSVFDNQNEVTKIKDEVKRILVFKTEPIPRYLAEMLHVAVAHDKFYINEVEFVSESKPEIENNQSNLVTFTANLSQRNVIGLNTHDTGFDCDSITTTDTMVLQTEDASGQISFTVPEGYLIATITGYRKTGSPVIIAGTSAGATDIVYSMSLSSGTPLEVATVNTEISFGGDNTLYCTISGAGATADVYVLLLKNRQ